MTSTRPKLRALREERGWTQQDVADQVARMAWLRRHERVGVNADMVSKWERGQKRPTPLYRDMLAEVFSVDAHDLGLGGSAPAEAAVRGDVDGNSLIEMLGGAASLLDQLGAAGSILQPRMFDVWKDELMQRRALLKLMGLATTAGVVPALDRDSTRSGKATPSDVQDLDHLADRYQALYHSTAPAVLMTPVVAHLETLRDFLRQGASAQLRRKLFANRARVATLAGRLAFFDLKDSLAARGFYNLALESAREANDHLQAAAALGHVAFIPAAEFCYSAALDYLRAATSQVNKHPDGRLASWLSAVESEIRADAGTHAEARAAIDRARERLASPGLIVDLPWFDYYDSARLSGFAGYALLRDGQFEASKSALTDAAGHLARAAVKQKAVFLADIASVELAGGDLDEACASAGEAADSLRRAGYAVGLGRLREFRRSVEQWAGSTPVRALDEQLAVL
ncbi:MAG TPA: helix-turn-helix transcriptional regulator [Streptosporangiaceae bacterium]|nr:helix-turn-helix transcriptional regulator [Streptosporangiaceae bacterium]